MVYISVVNQCINPLSTTISHFNVYVVEVHVSMTPISTHQNHLMNSESNISEFFENNEEKMFRFYMHSDVEG